MNQLPSQPSLAHLRKQAKSLLRAFRAVDPSAIATVAAHLPAAGADPAAYDLALHDAQSALARSYGFPSWTSLRLEVERRTLPDDVTPDLLARFVDLATEDDPGPARALLSERPVLAGSGLAAACLLGDVTAVREALTDDPDAATEPVGPLEWPPLAYVVTSCFGVGDPAVNDRLAETGRLLLEAGASPNTTYEVPRWGRLPVLYPVTGPKPNLELARLLLERGADPNDGESVYHGAQFDRSEALELLLAHGADISGRNTHWGNTPLYFLLGHRRTDRGYETAMRGVRWLLDHGADPNVTSYEGREPALMAAVKAGVDPGVLRALLDAGADPDARRADGRTAYALAMLHGNLEAAKFLEAHGAETSLSPIDALVAACAAGDPAEIAAARARVPGFPDYMNEEERRLIADVAGLGAASTVAHMVEAGWPLDARGMEGGMPLHQACWTGDLSVAQALLDRGADPNAPCLVHQSPPLGWAALASVINAGATSDHAGIVRALLAAGADPTAPANASGHDLIQQAEGNPEIQTILREAIAGR